MTIESAQNALSVEEVVRFFRRAFAEVCALKSSLRGEASDEELTEPKKKRGSVDSEGGENRGFVCFPLWMKNGSGSEWGSLPVV